MAKKNPKNNERRAMVEQLRTAQARKERRRSLLILGACVAVVAALLGSAAFVAIKDSRDKEKLRNSAMDDIGVSSSAAKCGEVTSKKTDGQATHDDQTPLITYTDSPPSFGNHRSQPAPFNRPFYTDDRPEVAQLVHNLEHGYAIAWYDETLAEDDTALDELKSIAEKFNIDKERFIVAPYYTKEHDGSTADGEAFPDGAHLALTRWSADAEDTGNAEKQMGNWQYCGGVSGAAISDFFEKWPNAESPEVGLY